MVFYGAGGHGKVVVEAFLDSGGKVTAIVDDNASIDKLLNIPLAGKYEPGKYKGTSLVVSIGENDTRKRIVSRLTEKFGTVIHPASVVSRSAIIGPGTAIMAGSVINADSVIGNHVIINSGSVVDHDCKLEDFVHLSPNATLCGGVVVGEGTHVGAGATVIPNVRIGKWATIGAGAVIIADVPDYAVVVGVPGSVKKFNSPRA